MTRLPRSLRFRLGIAVATLLAGSFALTFFAVYRVTGSTVRQQLQRQLDAQLRAFSRALTRSDFPSEGAARAAAAAYVQNLPFTASSTLLFATASGRLIATNQPRLFSGSSQGGGEGAELAAQRRRAIARLLYGAGPGKLVVPPLGRLLVERRVVETTVASAVVPPGDDDVDRVVALRYPIAIGVGQSLAPVASAQAGVAKAFLLAGGAVLALSLVGAFLLGERFAGPLRRMAAVARSVDGGDLSPRIEGVEGRAEEVAVLAHAFNHMLDRLTAAFARQRAFIADASHELRTPLTVLRGQLELLLASAADGELRRVARLMEAEVLRMNRLVDDLLLLVRGERGELLNRRELEVGPFLRELWQASGSLGERRFHLGELPEGTLYADPDRLAQALRNLIVNAIAHTAQPAGRVGLFASAIAREGGCWLALYLDDDGPGVPEEERELVFERFYRTDRGRDRAHGGSGLGLAIVKAIVQAHGGKVWVERSPWGGARFAVLLPGFSPQPQPAPPPPGGRFPAARP